MRRWFTDKVSWRSSGLCLQANQSGIELHQGPRSQSWDVIIGIVQSACCSAEAVKFAADSCRGTETNCPGIKNNGELSAQKFVSLFWTPPISVLLQVLKVINEPDSLPPYNGGTLGQLQWSDFWFTPGEVKGESGPRYCKPSLHCIWAEDKPWLCGFWFSLSTSILCSYSIRSSSGVNLGNSTEFSGVQYF